MINGYELTQFLARGDTSCVFVAQRSHSSLQVVMKVVWHPHNAVAEAENMAKLKDNKRVPIWLDHFEASFNDIAPSLDYFSRFIEDAPCAAWVQQSFHLEDDDPVGVLVFLVVESLPLVGWSDTQDLEETQRGTDALYCKDWETQQWFRQLFHWPLALRDKGRIVREVAQCLAECHARDVVHGDLNPENIHYAPETGIVTLLDWCGVEALGCPGWQAPEHLMMAAGLMKKPTKGTDIFLLGLLIKRLFEYESEHDADLWLRLANRCFAWEAEDRPTAFEIVRALDAVKILSEFDDHQFQNQGYFFS